VNVGGYGKLGAPANLIKALADSPAKNLTIITGIAACPEKGCSVQELLEKNKVSTLVTASVGENQTILDQYKKGLLEIQLLPLGTLAEKARSGGFGIPAFYSSVGLGTFHDEGGIPTKYAKDGKTVLSVNLAKEKRMFRGREYLLEKTILSDYALIKAWKADTKGNCILKLANRNLSIDLAIAGKVCIVEAEEVVEAGKLDGDDIHLAGIFVHKVVKATPAAQDFKCDGSCPIGTGAEGKARSLIVKRAAQEVKKGAYVVLGCGLAKAIEMHVPASHDIHVVIPETGIFGATAKGNSGDLTDGCLRPVGLRKNAAIVKASDGFAALRGGHLSQLFTEAYQVSCCGDIASIEKGDKVLPNPGVHMDIANAGYDTPLIALMEMTTNGKPNLVKECTYRVAGKKCVSKLITDMGVFEFKADGMHLTEVAPGVEVDQIKSKTPVEFKVAENLKTMSI